MSATTSPDCVFEMIPVELWNACPTSRQRGMPCGTLILAAISRRSKDLSTDSVPCDLLPAFSKLTSDEDREKKALGSIPGTYHVIVVPASFAHLPEYTDDALESVPGSQLSSPISDYSSHDHLDETAASGDPNVVILNRFKDSRKQVYPCRRSSTQTPESDLGSNPLSAMSMYTALQDIAEDRGLENIEVRNYEMALLDHFQNVVWMQLISGADSYMGTSVFEQEASNFPPLLHVMMALSALCLVRQGNVQNMDALEYYHQALPSLQSSLQNCEDLLSNGLFLTHFLLLIYEVAFAKPSNGSTLWSHHMSRLLQLSLLRQSVPERERYPFIIWSICHIDLYALLSGTGAGEYVKAAMENSLLPEAESLLYPVSPEGSSMMYPEEYDTLPLIMRLYRGAFLLAVRLGLFAAELRRSQVQCLDSHVDPLYRQLEDLRGAFRQLWSSRELRFLAQNQSNLPKRSQHGLQQLSVLFHTALLFSYTSLWRGQNLNVGSELEKETHYHTEAILHVAETMVAQGRPGFLAFPLFLSGAVTSSSGLKMLALELLANVGESGMGYDAATTCSMLQIICEVQMQHSRGGGYVQEVDWMEMMANHGFQLVNSG